MATRLPVRVLQAPFGPLATAGAGWRWLALALLRLRLLCWLLFIRALLMFSTKK
jgi:hypothetical protein